MNPKDLEDTLAAIAGKAKALREAGVSGPVTIGDVSFELDGPEPAAPVMAQPQEQDLPPIDDPETYGGFVPHRRRRGEPAPDETE